MICNNNSTKNIVMEQLFNHVILKSPWKSFMLHTQVLLYNVCIESSDNHEA